MKSPEKKIKQELTKLWTGELVAVMISVIFILAFAVIEWINYYKIRLSYSYNPLVLLKHIKNGKLSKSRLAREISKR